VSTASCWQISLTATAGTFKAFELVLEPFCEAVSCFPIGDESIWQVTGFAREKPDKSVIESAVSILASSVSIPVPVVRISPVEERDWETESFANFPPIRVGRYYIYGSHETDDPPPGFISMCLNAGPAFGTGRHASTMGALWALDDLAKNHHVRRVHHVLDMGCGSGILAMAIAKTWHTKILASDIDPRAVSTCLENVRDNGLRAMISPCCANGYHAPGIARRSGYDLIVSNILANPLCKMAGDLSRHLAPGGIAVLGGFLVQDWRRVAMAHREWGLTFVRRYEIDDWQTLVVTR